MITEQITQFLSENAGIASVSELAALLNESEGRVRAWARGNPHAVRRLGSTFAFTSASIETMLDDFEHERGTQEATGGGAHRLCSTPTAMCSPPTEHR